MSDYKVGHPLSKRCNKCFHPEVTINQTVQKEFSEKIAYILWLQCPDCGFNDTALLPKDE
ncbi:hypothetical protein [Halobacillus salinus]|uniref:Uncharacterized protein n=1 Tax=Halobacillus salinus TaxID=192814 RepID=A0A4Z0H8M6_9BACI|nr:hypothetical protein [Halobacillus salinus]TGB05185.1 hypothetical protein E4663_09405 [Halobacillus salinus]